MSASDGLGSRKGRSLRNQSFGRQKIDSFIDCPINDWDVSEYLLESLKETIPDPQMMHYELIGVTITAEQLISVITFRIAKMASMEVTIGLSTMTRR